MHQTTVRFGPDLWEALEEECSSLGVSVAQFLREAALARLAYTAGRRGDVEYAKAYVQAGTADADGASEDVSDPRGPATAPRRANRTPNQMEAGEQRDAAAAVKAQSELVWRRSRDLREQAAELRRLRRGGGFE
jgi:hypothetical protein